MTMADRNFSEERDQTLEQADQQTSQHTSLPQTSISPGYNSDKDTYKLDLGRSSLGLTTSLSTRDSGYCTDLSPATIASPATNKQSQHQFRFDDIDHFKNPDLENRPPLRYDHSSPCLTVAKPEAHCQVTLERPRCSRTNQRRSPVARKSRSLREIAWRVTHVSSPSISESSDTNAVQFDFESEDEDAEDEVQNENTKNFTPFTTSPNSNLSDVELNYDDEDDGDSAFYTCKDSVRDWNIASEPHTPRSKRRSQSGRQQRYFSADSYDDDSFLGACGGSGPSWTDPYFDSTYQLRDSRSHIRRGLNHGQDHRDLCSDVRHLAIGNTAEWNITQRTDNSCGQADISFTGSQGFKPGFFDCDTQDNDSHNILTCDPGSKDDKEVLNESSEIPGASRAVMIARERPVQATTSNTRRRRHGVATNLLVSDEYLPTWFTTVSGVSVHTQTPHLTSVMIQRVLLTPVPLPNEARGTAASRLHRLSESGVPFPPSPSPLPDIIPSVGRDRSQSFPNLQSFSSRQRAIEFGQTLRRLSDEFNLRRNLSPVNEEFDGHPASYPRMNRTYVRNTITQFGALLRDTFRGRSNSSS